MLTGNAQFDTIKNVKLQYVESRKKVRLVCLITLPVWIDLKCVNAFR